MAGTYGGETPLIHQDGRFTVEAPAGTSTAQPVTAGEIYKIGGTTPDGTGLKLVAAVAADKPSSVWLVQALENAYAADTAIGVIWLSGGSGAIRIIPYDGTAPTVGQAIAVAAGNVKKVTGIAAARTDGLIVKVDTVNKTVEVIC